MKLSFRRKAVNAVMLALTGVCTVVAVGLLFFVLGYLFVQGGFSLSWDFFTKLPVPVGEMGGGMANALLGSAKVVLLATCIGVPIGFLAGVYLAEYAGGAYASVRD
jgi:phosphate transport system permease protein